MSKVLNQVIRVLKTGGSYIFYEHVTAGLDSPLLRLFQRIIAPLLYLLGNGCTFRNTWVFLSNSTNLPGFEVSLTKFDADVKIPFIKPHIKGKATKIKSS